MKKESAVAAVGHTKRKSWPLLKSISLTKILANVYGEISGVELLELK